MPNEKPYRTHVEARGLRAQTFNRNPDKGAKQSFADDCDINQILERHRKTGLITHLASSQPRYMDVTEIGDYREQLERVRNLEAFFMGLPAAVRGKFGHDLENFMEAMSDPSKREAFEQLAHQAVDEIAADDEPSTAAQEGPKDPDE